MSKRGSIILKQEQKPSIKKASSSVHTTVQFPPQTFIRNQNNIRTTKYSILTFIPLNLYFQFKRFYNLYFLLGALSVFLGYSSLSIASQIAPLLIVLTFSAAKEAIEDYNRYKQDSISNAVLVKLIEPENPTFSKRRSSAYRGHQIHVEGETEVISLEHKTQTTILSQDAQPGDILLIKKGEKVVVDMIMLSSSYDDGIRF